MPNSSPTIEQLDRATADAVAHYWRTRSGQAEQQQQIGHRDQGFRGAVTGGAQMDGFVTLFARIATEAGISPEHVFYKRALELPGYFRPTKKWDLLIVKAGQLIAALEAKSQVGPSFGNNFNNRTEEAMGSALDLWTAYREGAFNKSMPPFLGYFFMLEDCPACRTPLGVKEPHFQVFSEFVSSSYAQRYEIFCRKLVRERHYSASAFIISKSETGIQGVYQEPAVDLSIFTLAKALAAHVSAYA